MKDVISQRKNARVSLAEAPSASGEEWRILLAEDNPIYQTMTVRILAEHGHRVTVAGNGKEALAAFKRDSFTLVVMDLEMPEMNGLEAATAMRECERHTSRHTPILAVTSCASEEDKRSCRAAGMDGHLTKPVQASTLLPALKALLERGRVAPERKAKETYHDVPFDYQSVLGRVDGNLNLLREITQMFLEECPSWLHEIRASIDQADARRLKLAAHTLRGAVANFSAAAAQQAAHALEGMGRTGNLTGAAEALSELEEAIQRLHPSLNKLIEPSLR